MSDIDDLTMLIRYAMFESEPLGSTVSDLILIDASTDIAKAILAKYTITARG